MNARRLCISLCLLLCLNTQAAERQELSISVGDWPPYLSADLKHNGVIAHLISDLFADEGYHVSFRFQPWPRAYAATASGRFAATGVWMYKNEREADFLYSAPILDEQFVFFHLKSLPFDWRSFYDLTGMTIGGGLGHSYGAKFDAFLDTGKVRMERVPSDMQNFEKLLKNRVVLYPQEINVGYAALHNHFTPADIAKVTHHRKPLLNNYSYLLFPRQLEGSQALRDRFNQRLQQYRGSGRYQQYFRDLQLGKYQQTATEENALSTDLVEP
jgi:polar amino acid transport system substrate-binding protein